MSRLSDRRTLARYGAVAAIVLVIGAIFVRQQFFSGGATVAGQRPAVGAVAPDFALETPDGRLVHLSDFRGKTVLLNFWATWCGPCRQEIPDLERAYQAREAKGDLVVLGVDVQEGSADVASFVREFGMTYPVVMDRDGAVKDHYRLPGLPGTFFIDRKGVIRQQSLGPIGPVLPSGIAAADAEKSAS